jgi:hypothetical protein
MAWRSAATLQSNPAWELELWWSKLDNRRRWRVSRSCGANTRGKGVEAKRGRRGAAALIQS